MSTATLAQTGEDALVRRLSKNLPLSAEVIAGAGDDCAVVKPLKRGTLQLLKTDCVIEGVHFAKRDDPRRAGWKAIARAISDIAAMGGAPQHALITLLCPGARRVSEIKALYAGMKKCARKFAVSIVGGETSAAPLLAVIVSLTGSVRAARCVRRDGARPGDVIFVTGRLGGSLRGHHLDFTPRVAEGRWLAQHFKPHAMMDLSDGLAMDLPRMAAAGGVGFVVDEKALPRRRGSTAQEAWGDGEDYELLFATPPRTAARLESCWRRQFPRVPLTRIGRFVPRGEGRAPSFKTRGWEHFRK
jgi:thiamine-monophosphate kinase